MSKPSAFTEPSVDWARDPVLAVMTRDVVCVAASEPMNAVRQVLEGAQFHHLPVVDAGKLVGMISARNLALASVLECPPHGGACTAADVMTREPITLKPDGSLAAAARAMLDQRVSALPIVDATGALQGIVTRADLLRALAQRDA